ncbi:hypothetical protein ACVWYU_000821 [Pseudomonas sp. TE12234]
MYRNGNLALFTAGSLAAAISTSQVNAQEQGFLEDSSLTLNTRHWYSHEVGHKATYFKLQTPDGVRKLRDRTAWLQGFRLDFVSGFTDGPVKFGLDLSTFSAVALERSRTAAAGGSNRMLVDKDGDVVDDWSKLGIAALKFKVAETLLKVGRQQVRTPMMSYTDTRTLPSTFNGISLESHDIEGLTIKSGYFDRGSPRTGAGSEDLSPTYGSRLVTSDFNAYAGADYLSAGGWRSSAYVSRFDDIWDREYLGLGKKSAWGPVNVDVQLDAYNTQSSGREIAGNINQQAYGLTITPRWRNHTLKFGLQQIKGDEYFDYPAESNAISLPNTMLSFYNGPNERSIGVNYSTDFVAYGLPGLTTSLWYIKGMGIDGSHYNGGPNGIYTSVLKQQGESHYEVGTYASYTVQSGTFKNISLIANYSWHRASEYQLEGNLEEFRLIVNVPIKIF